MIEDKVASTINPTRAGHTRQLLLDARHRAVRAIVETTAPLSLEIIETLVDAVTQQFDELGTQYGVEHLGPAEY